MRIYKTRLIFLQTSIKLHSNAFTNNKTYFNFYLFIYIFALNIDCRKELNYAYLKKPFIFVSIASYDFNSGISKNKIKIKWISIGLPLNNAIGSPRINTEERNRPIPDECGSIQLTKCHKTAKQG